MLSERQQQQGAQLAPDGIPLHFGSETDEYHIAQSAAVVMDRSHEARIRMTGADRLAFVHRICTNDLQTMVQGDGRGTALTKANARMIDRILVYHLGAEALIVTQPGRGDAIHNFLQRNIFFNDDAQLDRVAGHQFVLHGPTAAAVIAALGVVVGDAATPLWATQTEIAGYPVIVARRKPLVGTHWSVITQSEQAAVPVWDALCDAGAAPAGALTYNRLRIQAGMPAFGREIHSDYLPLEIGLWDEVSLNKGCYTGQEIIARMESRARLARVMVRVRLSDATEAPVPIVGDDGKAVGTLTSSVQLKDGEHVGIAVLKNGLATPGATFRTEANQSVIIQDLAGSVPPEHMLKQG